ncbi:Oidioi.mRNA.OKI2018_I69.PAR.g12641.t1.cds [Oikopleura dioica]|uniref:Oidioi.mRNA.OKI2018_I69.PAR.g12641.t1.cds n=1 Tax=Oikopleura dioica TaxID=34765 RepID=A0ABN7S0W8_OIKDI|nr:Oidioi.mRNA.OKI2018_I69.PAR.g12641.t1.cds [Oikopleura dioica]
MTTQENEIKQKSPMDYGMYPLFDCGIETPVRINKEYITDRGHYGFCERCERGVLETTDQQAIDESEDSSFEESEIERICRHCCSNKFRYLYDDDEFKYTPSDAKFRCPAFKSGKGCNAKDLNYQQFVVGLCCDAGIEWTAEPEEQRYKLAYLQQCFEKSEIELIQAEKNYYGMFKERTEKGEELKKAQDEEDTSMAKFKIIWGKVEEQEKIHSRTRKRFSFCSYKYSERCQWEPPRKFRKTHSMKNFCSLCPLPYYNADGHQKALLPCGHSFGYTCIQTRRTCPKNGCNRRFTYKQIYVEAESDSDE